MVADSSTRSRDESAALLTNLLQNRQSFIYARVGDGDLYVMFEVPPYGNGEEVNTNGETAVPGLAERVRDALSRIARLPGYVFIGDYLSRATGDAGLTDQWEQARQLLADRPLVHVEALLLHRPSADLISFYYAASEDPRRKVYVAPGTHIDAAAMLRAEHVVIPPHNAYELVDEIVAAIDDLQGQVVYLSAGYATKLITAEAWRPGRTLVDLGSALDPVVLREPTRTGQISHVAAQTLLRGLL